MAAQNTQANNPQGDFEDEDLTEIEIPDIPKP
jgi:hypothetical protein